MILLIYNIQRKLALFLGAEAPLNLAYITIMFLLFHPVKSCQMRTAKPMSLIISKLVQRNISESDTAKTKSLGGTA